MRKRVSVYYDIVGRKAMELMMQSCIRTKQTKRKSKTLSAITHDLGAWMLILPFLLFMLFLNWMPTIKGVIWSFFDMQGYTVGKFSGLENYIVVLKNTEFVKVLWNTIQYVLWSLVLGFWLPIVAAILLNEIKIGRGYFKFAVYFPQMAPAIAVSMLWYYIYFPNNSGLLNMFLSQFGIEPMQWLQNPKYTIMLIIVSSTWRGMGGSMLVYLAALQGVNRELYEAALIDGAGFMKRVLKITLPQISGIVLLNFVRQIVAVFQIMEQPLAMTGGGPNGASTSLGLLVYRYAFQNYKVGNALALNVVMFLILIVMTIFYFAIKNKVEQDA